MSAAFFFFIKFPPVRNNIYFLQQRMKTIGAIMQTRKFTPVYSNFYGRNKTRMLTTLDRKS